MNSVRTRPVRGPAPPRATGTSSSMRPSPGRMSPCHAAHTTVYPRRMRNPLPASRRVLGSFDAGASLKNWSSRLLPRLPYPKKSLRLPEPTGLSMQMSVAYSTRPASLRGALSRSTMSAYAGASGSTANRARPTRRSYGPASPNVWPSANGSRPVIRNSIDPCMTPSGAAPITTAYWRLALRRTTIDVHGGAAIVAARPGAHRRSCGRAAVPKGPLSMRATVRLRAARASSREFASCARVPGPISRR